MPLPKQQRITSTKTIGTIMRSARPRTDGGVSVRVGTDAPTAPARFVVLVPRAAVPTAVQRNSIRRNVSAMVHRILKRHPAKRGINVVITVNDAHLFDAAEATLLSLMRKSGILTE